MNVKDKTYYCKNCDTQISWASALYGQGRCNSCATKGKNHPLFGKPRSKLTCLKIRKALIGTHLSKETREKISKSNIGRKVSLETRKKIGLGNKGKKVSLQSRLKMSKSHMGKHKGKNNYMFGKHPSKETRKKQSEARIGKYKGKKHPNWQGGVSFLPYTQDFNKELKFQIRQRDNFTCQCCKLEEKNNFRKLDIHHIDYDKQNCKKDNLITLCVGCNAKANFNRDYWFAYYTYIIQHFGSKNG